jgi:Lipocalin-like domain
MKIKTYAISACAGALIALSFLIASAVAQAPAKSLKDQLHGAWHLVSVTVGEAQPYGVNPMGLMYIGDDGSFSVVAIGEGTMQKIAYFGTYSVDDAGSAITFHVTASTSPTGAGRDHKWLVALDGDVMTENLASPTGGPGSVTVLWKRGS